MLPSGELSALFKPAVFQTMNAIWEHAQERHGSHDLPPAGGKWHNRMQLHCLMQEKNSAVSVFLETCRLRTWPWISIQHEGPTCADLPSSSKAPSNSGSLRQPDMRWHWTIRRVILVPLQCILRPCRHSLPTIGCDAGMGSSVRSACSGTALMKKWPTTMCEPYWRSFSPCKEPHSSCFAGNGVRPSMNRTSIMPSRISLAVGSGHWFRNTFLMLGQQRLHQNQGMRKMKVAEVTNRRNDRKGALEQILKFPPVGGTLDGHGNIWTAESKHSYKMTMQSTLAFHCGGSYMPWKLQKTHMNAQSMTHARQPNPGTLESKTPEQHQAGRKPNTHIHSISCSREHGQERVQGRGGGRNGQDRTSETMAVNWGKRARRGEKQTSIQKNQKSF